MLILVDAFLDVFVVVKFLFGLGALFGLLGIGAVCVWYIVRVCLGCLLQYAPPQRCRPLRKLFLDL